MSTPKTQRQAHVITTVADDPVPNRRQAISNHHAGVSYESYHAIPVKLQSLKANYIWLTVQHGPAFLGFEDSNAVNNKEPR